MFVLKNYCILVLNEYIWLVGKNNISLWKTMILYTALYALGLIDNERFFSDYAADRSDGALTRAKAALLAFVGLNFIAHKVFTDVRGTFFVHDVRYVFVFEVREC